MDKYLELKEKFEANRDDENAASSLASLPVRCAFTNT